MTLQLWGAVLLVGLGVLLGLLLEAATRNVLDRALQAKLRQAEERHRLDEAWRQQKPGVSSPQAGAGQSEAGGV